MNKIVNKSLLTGENFMSELHLRHPGFSYSAWGEFPNIVKEFKNSEKQVTQNIYIEMNQAKLVLLMMLGILIVQIQLRELFQTKFVKYRAYKIARNHKYDEYQRGLANMVCKIFDKKTEPGARVNEVNQ